MVREAHDITIFEHGDQISVSLHLKVPAESSLEATHAVAQRIEVAIVALPRVSDVQTHLEPLERPVATDPSAIRDSGKAVETIQAIALEQTGAAARDVRLVPTETGSVLFITIAVGATTSLADAHHVASELEEALRGRLSGIADVVVRTEP